LAQRFGDSGGREDASDDLKRDDAGNSAAARKRRLKRQDTPKKSAFSYTREDAIAGQIGLGLGLNPKAGEPEDASQDGDMVAAKARRDARLRNGG